MVVQAAVFVLSGCEHLRMCYDDPSESQRGGWHSVPGGRLIRNETLRQNWENMQLNPFQGESGRYTFFPCFLCIKPGCIAMEEGCFCTCFKTASFNCYSPVRLMSASPLAIKAT